jgi:hypothetical protein
MKSLKQMIVVTFFAVLAGGGLHAQTVSIRAAIPFNFHAGDKLMPAGEYEIHGQGPFLWFRGADSGEPALALLTIGAESPEKPRPARLSFNRYGNEYFLESVWDSFTRNGRQVSRAAREKELAKGYRVPVPIVITLASSK